MKLGAFIEALQDAEKAPGGSELSVELSKVISVDPRVGEAYEVRLDFPIVGLAVRAHDLCLVVEHTKEIIAFGTPKKLESE